VNPDEPDTPDDPDDPPDNPGQPDDPAVPDKPARATNLQSTVGLYFVNLSWNTAARATSYEVYYSLTENFASAIKFGEDLTTTEITVTGLEANTAYNFWVVAKNSGGSAIESRMHSARTDFVEPPARAANLQSKVGMQYVTLSWNAAARATSYAVYYSLTANFASAIKFTEDLTTTEIMVTGLEDNTAYNFWVVAKNLGGSATESQMHTSDRTSDPIPEYLLAGMAVKNGQTAYYVASNLWPTGDRYGIRDLGESYPAHERYLFSYGAGNTGMDGTLYPGGALKFVRTFANPLSGDGPNKDVAGCLIYEYEATENGQKVKKYQAVYYWDPHLPPTVLIDYQSKPSHPPAAIMGTANDYKSGVGETTTYTLERAIEIYAHPGGNGRGMGAYISDMRIYYSFNPDL
jgi:hypothetical protein